MQRSSVRSRSAPPFHKKAPLHGAFLLFRAQRRKRGTYNGPPRLFLPGKVWLPPLTTLELFDFVSAPWSPGLRKNRWLHSSFSPSLWSVTWRNNIRFDELSAAFLHADHELDFYKRLK